VYCTNCGAERPDDATTCPSCGRAIQHFPLPPRIPNYLVQSILVTLCCCLPFGIVAVVYSSQVNSKLASGDVIGAEAASRNARMWVLVAFILGILSAAGFGGLAIFDYMNQ
jgi:hypothetical protein